MEPVGLTLGIVSVLLTGADKFRALNIITRKSKQIQNFERRVLNQLSKLKVELAYLLDAVLESSNIYKPVEDLLADPLNDLWTDPVLLAKVKEYFGDRYELFESLCLHIAACADNINGELKRLSKTSPLGWQWSQLKRSSIEESLLELEQTNHRLSILLFHTARDNLHCYDQHSKKEQVPQDETTADAKKEEDKNEEPDKGGERDADTMTIHSVTTLGDDEESPLSFLPLSLKAPDCHDGAITEHGLLDTAASKCCISEKTSRQVQALPTSAGEERIWAATEEVTVSHMGKVKLDVRWRDQLGRSHSARIWFRVVKGLICPIILSKQFCESHPEVWAAAVKDEAARVLLAPFKFMRKNEEQKQSDDRFAQEQADENSKRDSDEDNQYLEELQRRLAKYAQPDPTTDNLRPSGSLSTSAVSENTLTSSSACHIERNK